MVKRGSDFNVNWWGRAWWLRAQVSTSGSWDGGPEPGVCWGGACAAGNLSPSALPSVRSLSNKYIRSLRTNE